MAVYIVEAVGTELVKIGFSSDPERRVKSMRTQCPFPIEVLACVEGDRVREKLFHRKFRHLRTSGEWFKKTPEVVAFAKALGTDAYGIVEEPIAPLPPVKIAEGRTYSVRDLQLRYRVTDHTVLGWIRDGDLKAINTGRSLAKKKPRWSITEEQLRDFERLRTSPERASPVRRKKRDAGVIQFY